MPSLATTPTAATPTAATVPSVTAPMHASVGGGSRFAQLLGVVPPVAAAPVQGTPVQGAPVQGAPVAATVVVDRATSPSAPAVAVATPTVEPTVAPAPTAVTATPSAKPKQPATSKGPRETVAKPATAPTPDAPPAVAHAAPPLPPLGDQALPVATQAAIHDAPPAVVEPSEVPVATAQVAPAAIAPSPTANVATASTLVAAAVAAPPVVAQAAQVRRTAIVPKPIAGPPCTAAIDTITDPTVMPAKIDAAAVVALPATTATAIHPSHVEAAAAPVTAIAPPAAQIESPIRVALAGGHGHVAILLQPAELGRIDLQIARAPDGSVRVTLTAERPDTARRLLADQPALHAALDRAGLSAERVVTVQTEPAAAMTDTGGSAPGNFPSGNSPPGEHRPRSEPRQHAATPVSPAASPTIRMMTARAGIDITA